MQYSIVQNKFREWFGEHASDDLLLPDESDQFFESPVPANPSINADAAEANRLKHRTRKRRHRTVKRQISTSKNLSELLFFGFVGAVISGAIVGITFYIMDLNLGRWYNNTWPSPSSVILIAGIFGFNIGLVNGYHILKK